MKKYASLLLFALFLNSCDDGDLTVETIDFTDPAIVAQTCDTKTNALIYKLKAQESLLIQLPENSLPTDATVAGTPLMFDINNSTYRVVYRAYNGTVAVPNICGAIPPTTPAVTEEWQATAGKIAITSLQTTKTNEDGSTQITGYTHNINFQNITFMKPAGPQVQETYPFGNFTTTYTSPNTTFSGVVKQCPDSKQVYSFSPSTALTIDNIESNLIQKEVTPSNQPRTGLIGATTNKVTLRTYTGTLDQSYFCNNTIPSTPIVNEVWIAENGVANVSGIIQVSTTNVAGTFFHKIVIVGGKFTKGNSSFKLPTTYTLGTLEQ